MRRTPIRMKLAAALTVPLIGLVLITAVEVVDTADEGDRVRNQTALARASIGPAGIITSLQNERTWAAVELIGQEGAVQPPVVGYEESRAVTDDAIIEFRDTLESGPAGLSGAYDAALDELGGLRELRSRIDADTAPRDMENVPFSNEVFTGYSDLIRPFLEANTRVALAIDDAELRQATSLVDLTTRQVETLADLARTSILEIVIGGGLDESGEIAAVARLKSLFDRTNDELRNPGPPFDDPVAAAFPEDLASGFSAQLDKAIAGEDVEMAALLAPLDVPGDAGYMGLRNALVDVLNDRADELNDAAATRERIYVAMAVATLVVALALMWIVSRSITRPLRSLTRQAKDMADRRLPHAVINILETPLGENVTVPHVAPVRVRTRDEVSDVAEALNTVQDTALDLAVEQAVLRRNIADSFVNLGRRNQNLLGRQLDFITELESNETGSDALANLFRLDHLATRMRRNAESLLVLAGIEPPRQWAAPVRLTDVIRAALGEVEDYQRVTVRGVEPATIIGSAAADLAHLLAELIENALVFSPPDQTVDIRGRNRDRGRGGYTLAVMDSGLGMPADEITAANRRLAGAESFTIAPSKYLGHYVAGNLAARHDIRVHLDNAPGTGITVTLTLPAQLLTDERVTIAPVTPPGGHRALPAPPVPRGLPAGPRPAATPVPAAAAAGHPSTPVGPPAGDRSAWLRSLPVASPPGAARPAPARRRPAGTQRRVPAVIDDPTLLRAIERFGPSWSPPPPAGAAREALTRRVKGAQLPRSAMTPLRGERIPPRVAPSTPVTAYRPAPSPLGPRPATDVQALLASFTAGVQRGLHDARRGAAAPGGDAPADTSWPSR
jgi:signal transduction histidine kinase